MSSIPTISMQVDPSHAGPLARFPYNNVVTLTPVNYTLQETGKDFVVTPKIAAETFDGRQLEMWGSFSFQRYDQSAKFQIDGFGYEKIKHIKGNFETETKHWGMWQFKLTSRRKWKITIRKIKGDHTRAREFTLSFDPNGALPNELKTVVLLVPFNTTSDQSVLFEYAVEWASTLVDANIANENLYAAVHANKINSVVTIENGVSTPVKNTSMGSTE